mmetsp:Transcript_122798/g.244270  ORF Transcript_122798/g.244270 Transcript_122798/m.244270 type:complete len:537 (+) Transcript_122798:21-1631(+)
MLIRNAPASRALALQAPCKAESRRLWGQVLPGRAGLPVWRAGVALAAGVASRTTGRHRHIWVHTTSAAKDENPSSQGMQHIVLFTRPGCPYCLRAKALLQSLNVEFGVVDVGIETDRRQEANELSGSNTLPQVLVGRRCLGGFDDISGLHAAGQLINALQYCAEDGLPVVPTPTDLLDSGSGLPPEVHKQLQARAETLGNLQYAAGSSPSLRAFARYAVTSKPMQDQQNNVPLNLAAAPGEPTPPPALPNKDASELAALLRMSMLQLQEEFVDSATGDVDYKKLKKSSSWALHRAIATELGNETLRGGLVSMSESDRKALLINLYNAMTFHGIVTFGRRSGLWYLYCFFITPAVSYRLAGTAVSLDDVENGMLRAQPGYFEKENQELQRQLRMPSVDARIHMALNCGARGCPAVAVYDGAKIDAELDDAVVAFVSDDRNVRVSRKKSNDKLHLALTSLFKMYIADFAGPGAKADSVDTRASLIRWLLPHLRAEKQELLSAVGPEGASQVVLEWLPYDWTTNGPDLELDWRIYRPTF